MSRKLIYKISSIGCITFFLFALLFDNPVNIQELIKELIQAETIRKVTEITKIMAIIKVPSKTNTPPESSIPAVVIQESAPRECTIPAVIIQESAPPECTIPAVVIQESVPREHILNKGILKGKNLALAEVSFEELPGWYKADVKESLVAFQTSCKTFLKQSPSHSIKTQHIKLETQDWQPACKAALELDSISEDSAKAFFEKWFHPIEFEQKKPVYGLFTGYYMPQIKGDLTKSAQFNTPIYGLPKNKYLTSYTRQQIDNGALIDKAPVIAWIQSPAERLFLEIEGSGVIQLPNGKNLYLGYAGENGSPYTSIAKVMIHNGIMTRDTASKKAIIRYLMDHPEEATTILEKNKSFVYFENLKKPMALGAQGIALTPGYSLAVDKKWIPLGTPLWLDIEWSDINQANIKQFQRLMIAQDTGGAIRGFKRGDIYWGSGELATFLGEHTKNEGHYWLLLPNHFLNRLHKKSL